METKQLTTLDILKDVLNILGDVKVPMSELESIGIPVGRAINGIKLCVDAMEKVEQEQQQKQEQQQEQDNVIELVPENGQDG